MYVVLDGDKVTGNVQFPMHDLGHVLDVSLPTDGAGVDEAVAQSFEKIRDYASNHFKIYREGNAVDIQFTGSRSLSRSIGSYAILDYEVIGVRPAEMRSFTVEFDGIIEARHHHEGLVLIHSYRGWGPLRTRDEQQHRFDVETRLHDIVLMPAGAAQDALGAAICVKNTVKEYWRRAKKRMSGD